MKELVKKFIEKYEVPENLKFLLKHYKNNLINDFIDDNLLFDINEINKENIETISNFDSYIDFIDWNIDTYNADLIKNIELFWEFIETFWDKDNFYENLMNWQNKAYQELLEDIKNKFVEFLKEQLD